MLDLSRSQELSIDLGFLSGLVGYRLRLVQIAAFKDFEERNRHFGAAPRYFGLLTLIEANPGLPQGRLAEAVHLVRSSLVPIIDRLEAEGLVERRPSPRDRRHKTVWLTARGARLLQRLKPRVLAHEDRLTAGLSDGEKRQLVHLLTRIDENLRSHEPAAAAA